MKIIKKIKKNFSNFDKITYFLKNFKYSLILICLLIIFLIIRNYYKNNYSNDKIVEVLNNSKFVGNAVAINKYSFLTTYNSIINTCKIKTKNERLKIFLAYNDSVFEVVLSNYDEYKDLAVLTMHGAYKKYINLNNFVLFSKTNKTSNKDIVFVSRTTNGFKYQYDRKKIKEDKKLYTEYVKMDKFRKNNGEIILNNKLEFVGMVSDTKRNRYFNLFNKKVNVVNVGDIKDFLRNSGVYYYVNIKDSNLYLVKNYIDSINYKVLCYIEKPEIKRVFKVYK